jgi:hypothetical protein
MEHALILNIAIVIAVIIGMVVLENPLALFALLLLKEMPYGLLQKDEEDPEDPEGIGFIR